MLFQNTREFFKNKEAAALGFLFSSSSLMLGIWAAALPFIKEQLGLSDQELGLILLFGPLGAMTGVLFSAKLFSKVSFAHWLGKGNAFYCILMCIEIFAPTQWIFAIALFFRGVTGFTNGVAVNTVVGFLEQKYDKRFMATCHGMYSIGGGISAGFAALLYGVGIESIYQGLIMGGIIVGTIIYLHSYYMEHDVTMPSKKSFILPKGHVIGLSFICFVMFMSEGCIVDWSSIYLQRNLQVPLYLISLGYGGFAVAMTIGRFNGDQIIPKLGEKRIVIFSTLLAATGFLLVSLVPVATVAILGFTMIGLGCSCVVPVLFSAASRIKDVTPVQGFAMVTTGGLMGFMAGPTIIGFISEEWSLSLGFLFVVFMLLLATLTGWKNSLFR